jgi:SpoVK/Ycf46/Vps4 family AAA+-type ATPase
MRIIPFSQSIDPYMLHSNILKSMIDREKDERIKEDSLNEKNNEIEEEFVELTNVTNIDDLIKEGEKFNIEDKRRYSIDMLKLKNIIEPLKELQNVIGMKSVKKNVFEQLLYILQDLHDTNMMHTVIEGPPGVGKTLLGKILGKIYYKLNFLKKSEKNKNDEEINDIANHLMAMLNPNSALMRNGADKKDDKKDDKKKEDDFKFKVVRRSDLVGQYVGSTAIKTQKVIDEIEGGVLFIDEVYSLGSGGSNDKSDSFAKEAIDTLNQNLSENGDKFICIIAGYMNEIDRCFFAQNDGLRRRFPFKYSIEKYNSAELTKILEFKISEIKWSLDKDLIVADIEKFIEKNKKSFENFGGDIETLLLNIKIKHSTRVFGKDPKIRKLITMEDIKNAYTEFLKVRKEKEIPQFVKDMYI